MIKLVSKTEGIFVVAVLDCCRENLNEAKKEESHVKKNNNVAPASDQPQSEKKEEQKTKEEYQNLILIHACEVGKTVQAASEVSSQILEAYK